MKIIITESQYNLLLETKGVKAAQLLIDMAVEDYVEICDERKAFQNIELALCKGFKNGTVKLEVTKVDEIKNDKFEDNVFYVAHLILYVDKEWMLEDSYYEKFEKSLAVRLENILGSFRYYCYIDEVKMNDSVIKENDLKNTLLNRIEQDGWEDTSELVGDPMTLAKLAFDDNPIKFIDSLGLEKLESYGTYFVNNKNQIFLSLGINNSIVEVNYAFSDFLYKGFNLNRNEVKKIIKKWLFERYGINVKSITKIYV